MDTSYILLVTIGMWALGTVCAENHLSCYNCTNCDTVEYAKRVQCDGSCFKGVVQGINAVYRGCYSNHREDVCENLEETGASAYVCFCNKDLCNAGPVTPSPTSTPNSGSRPDLPLIALLPFCLMVNIYKYHVS